MLFIFRNAKVRKTIFLMFDNTSYDCFFFSFLFFPFLDLLNQVFWENFLFQNTSYTCPFFSFHFYLINQVFWEKLLMFRNESYTCLFIPFFYLIRFSEKILPEKKTCKIIVQWIFRTHFIKYLWVECKKKNSNLLVPK